MTREEALKIQKLYEEGYEISVNRILVVSLYINDEDSVVFNFEINKDLPGLPLEKINLKNVMVLDTIDIDYSLQKEK